MALDTAEDGLSLSETILAMDVVDTIRHDDRMREFELADEDRQKAAIERLRNAYAAQGDVVTDDVLKRALSKLNEDRFIHKAMALGPKRLFWKAFVRRGHIARNTAIALAATVVVCAGWSWGYDQFITQPRLATERRLEAERKLEVERTLEAERKLVMQIDEVIPRDLAAAVEYAEGFAKRLGDEAVIGRIAKQRSDVEVALLAKDVAAAESGIDALREVGKELKRREDAGHLVADAEALTAGPIASISNAKARAALNDIASHLREIALQGDEVGFRRTAARFKSFFGYILNDYTIQIVDRPGIQTGFARQNDQSGTKTWYLVVEAISPSGTAYPLEIKDGLVGKTKATSIWAIHVPIGTFEAIRDEKKKNGVIKNRIAGIKPAGTLEVVWKINAFDGETLNTW